MLLCPLVSINNITSAHERNKMIFPIVFKHFKQSFSFLGLKMFLPLKSSGHQNDSPSILRKLDALWKLSSNCIKHRKANRSFIYLKINVIVFPVEKQQEIKKAHHWELKSTNSGENWSAGSWGEGSSTTCFSCWNGVPHESYGKRRMASSI